MNGDLDSKLPVFGIHEGEHDDDVARYQVEVAVVDCEPQSLPKRLGHTNDAQDHISEIDGICWPAVFISFGANEGSSFRGDTSYQRRAY